MTKPFHEGARHEATRKGRDRVIKFTVPLKTKNPLNGAQGRSRGAVFAKAARRKKERGDSAACTGNAIYHHNLLSWHSKESRFFDGAVSRVGLTRLSPGKLDGDGLQAALKSVRDGIADALGVNDGSDAVKWVYEQRKCKRGEFGVEVQIS